MMRPGRLSLHDELDMDIFSRLAEDRVMAADELCGEKTWLESDFYRTWVEPFHIRYMLGAQIRGEDGSLCRLRIGQPFVNEDFAEAISVPRPSGRMPLLIRIHPLPQNDVEGDDRRAALALLVHNPEQKFQIAPKLMQRLFGLTPAEAALAQRLVEGLSLDAAAARLGIRKNTARAQLSAIFGKTGVTRQSSLVSLLLTSSEFL